MLINRFRSLRTDGPAAGAMRNTAWVFLEKILRLGLAFVMTAWMARYLGPADFGLLSYGLALVGLLGFLPGLGLEAVVRRDIMEKPAAAADLLATSTRLRLGATLLALVVLAGIVLAGERRESAETRFLLILGLGLFQSVLYLPELYFQAMGLARSLTGAQVAASLVAAGFRVGLIMGGATLVWFGVATLVEIVVTWLVLTWLAARRNVGWGSGRYCPDQARRLLRESWPLMLSGAAVVIYMRIDLVMLRMMAGDEEAGLYSAAVRVSEAIYFVPTALVMGLLPYWARTRQEGGQAYALDLQRIYDLQAAAAYAFVLPVSVASPFLITGIFGREYAAAVPVLVVHAWAGLFVFTGVTRSQQWVFENLNHLTLWTTVFGALCNIGLNCWLIPAHGAFGAALATVISYALAAWGGTFVLPRTRRTALMQTRALLLPFTGWRYLLGR